MVYPALRAALFRLDAERAHRLATGALGLAQHSRVLLALGRRAWAVSDPRLEQQLLGRHFANPVGLAAGFDKDARWVPALAAMGFGALEVGTVTPRPQPGNPRPRLWRHPRGCTRLWHGPAAPGAPFRGDDAAGTGSNGFRAEL